MKPGATRVRRVGRITVVWALACAVVVLSATASGAATASQALVVTPGTTRPLRSGGSATPFALALPAGARCPSDSTAPPYYQIGSYFDPRGVDPASILFKGLLPDRGLWLYAIGAPFEGFPVMKGTAQVQLPGSFSLSRFRAEQVFTSGGATAAWDAGVVCATGAGRVATYWNVRLTLTRTATDPHGFTWVAAPPSATSSGPPWPALIAIAVVVVLGALAVRVYRGGASRRTGGARPARVRNGQRGARRG